METAIASLMFHPNIVQMCAAAQPRRAACGRLPPSSQAQLGAAGATRGGPQPAAWVASASQPATDAPPSTRHRFTYTIKRTLTAHARQGRAPACGSGRGMAGRAREHARAARRHVRHCVQSAEPPHGTPPCAHARGAQAGPKGSRRLFPAPAPPPLARHRRGAARQLARRHQRQRRRLWQQRVRSKLRGAARASPRLCDWPANLRARSQSSFCLRQPAEWAPAAGAPANKAHPHLPPGLPGP